MHALIRGLAIVCAFSVPAAAARVGPSDVLLGAALDSRGSAIANATVTACARDKAVCITSYSGADGTFRLERLWPGAYTVSAFSERQAVQTRDIPVSVHRKPRNLRLTLDEPWREVHLSDPDYLEKLPEGDGKTLIRSVCIQCHGFTEKMLGGGKTRAEWEVTVDNMLAKIAPLPWGQRDTIVAYLANHLTPEAVKAMPRTKPVLSPEKRIPPATFIEYRMPPQASAAYDKTTGTALTTHDVRVDRKGAVWISEMARDALVKLDPRTGGFVEYPIPHKSSGPHGVILDANDDVWLTLIWADRLMKFDQAKETFTVDVKIPDPASWPHTIVADSRGRLWFTEMHGNAIGVFDPASESFDRFIVPTPRATPYGIAVDQNDDVWFTGITYHKIGKINPRTRQITEYPTQTPLSATRKMAVDADGNVWCTLFGAGKIARLDPRTGELTEFSLPARYSSPYDITVDRDGRVWFPDFTGNQVIAFRPDSGEYTEYPIPTPLSRPRIIDPDPNGGVWFSESEVGKVGRLIPR